jgi:hypothetical protein
LSSAAGDSGSGASRQPIGKTAETRARQSHRNAE